MSTIGADRRVFFGRHHRFLKRRTDIKARGSASCGLSRSLSQTRDARLIRGAPAATASNAATEGGSGT